MSQASDELSKKEPIQLTRLGSDECFVEIQGKKLLLSYDEAFELGLKLAKFIDCTGAEPPLLQHH